MRSRAMRRVWLRYMWDRLRFSFWFTPALMALGAIGLVWVTYSLDRLFPNDMLGATHLVLSGSPGELSSFLISIAASVLATTGVVFTLLTLPLSTVAAQYGSRLLRVFLGDRTTQLVLGSFVGTFVYCIVAVAVIPPRTVEPEGPQITATFGLVLTLLSFASLVWLIQHITTMLQAPNIAAAAGAELVEVTVAEPVRASWRQNSQPAPARGPLEAPLEGEGDPVRARRTGYVQYIDPEYILTLAHDEDLTIRLLCKPGYFVWEGMVVARVWPPGRVDEHIQKQIRQAYQIGNQRTPTQDIEYAVNQLVEMAVRAMSPAINDPFTAMTCLDHIGHGLVRFARQGGELPYNYDREGHLRLIFDPVTFGELLDAAFNMPRHAAAGNATVLLHMLDVIAAVSQHTPELDDRRELLRHANLIQAESAAGALIAADRNAVAARAAALEEELGSPA